MQNRPVVEARSSEPLNRLRTAALEALETAGRLPAKGDEGFEKTSINDMFAPDFGVNISGINIPADIASSFRCGVPNLSTLMGVVVNDRFTPTSTLLKTFRQGSLCVHFPKQPGNIPAS